MMVALNSTFASHCVTHCSRKLSPLLHSPPLPRKRERERARESVCVCVCERGRERERERERSLYGDRTPPGPCVPHACGACPLPETLPSRIDGLFSEQGPQWYRRGGVVYKIAPAKKPSVPSQQCSCNLPAGVPITGRGVYVCVTFLCQCRDDLAP